MYSEELVWVRGGRDSCTGKESSGKGWTHKAVYRGKGKNDLDKI